jgi:cytidyltransferase-like protein
MSKKIPVGPEPVLTSRKEVDALYETLDATTKALKQLNVEYIVTGGSLLGAIRQHSILFCDDDIDIAIIDNSSDGSVYKKVSENLQTLLKKEYRYTIKPWEGGDKVRPNRMSNVFLDLFVLRKYNNVMELKEVIGAKTNGQSQSEEYVQSLITKMQRAAFAQNEFHAMFPLWHFNTRKAIEMWTKEVYRPQELFPLDRGLRFGPLLGIQGPRSPVLLLKRAFGLDCFEVYYQSASHHGAKDKANHKESNDCDLKALVQEGGTWEAGKKMPLEDEHYLPMQPISRAKRRHTLHGREQLNLYLEKQSKLEASWGWDSTVSWDSNDFFENSKDGPPSRTVYMDGVFDLFHIGHLEAIQHCTKLGDKVIIGVTGQQDATGYKREPIITESERVAVVSAIKGVNYVVCPCPLIVTEEFMEEHRIDLVVHGFGSDADAERQRVFFEPPMRCGKFQRIPYYQGLSTTDILLKIRSMSEDAF